ncbi:MAG TPA: hypothetical protein VJW73_06010 [Gemmatimonadaceae bacterium]|nr:hypothetical protein [Gemmatimonadaceae bacterium]
MRVLFIVMVALPALLSAQGVGSAAPACPAAGPATELPLGGDSVARARPSNDSAAGARSGQQLGTAPDIILRASVSARELTFRTQPQVSIRLCGGTLDSIRVVERRNLPTPVVAGTTYHDVYVAVEILGHLTGSCIANGLTGGRAAPAASGPCAALGIRDSAGARAAPRRPE